MVTEPTSANGMFLNRGHEDMPGLLTAADPRAEDRVVGAEIQPTPVAAADLVGPTGPPRQPGPVVTP